MDLEAVASAADEFRERIRELEDYIEMQKENMHNLDKETEAERVRHKNYRDGIRDIVAELHNDTIPKAKIAQLEGGADKEELKTPSPAREPLEI